MSDFSDRQVKLTNFTDPTLVNGNPFSFHSREKRSQAEVTVMQWGLINKIFRCIGDDGTVLTVRYEGTVYFDLPKQMFELME